jgi:hypothetical protein
MTYWNLKINPYKAGIYFYILFFISVATMIGCSSFNKYREEYIIKKEARDILNTPDLN